MNNTGNNNVIPPPPPHQHRGRGNGNSNGNNGGGRRGGGKGNSNNNGGRGNGKNGHPMQRFPHGNNNSNHNMNRPPASGGSGMPPPPPPPPPGGGNRNNHNNSNQWRAPNRGRGQHGGRGGRGRGNGSNGRGHGNHLDGRGGGRGQFLPHHAPHHHSNQQQPQPFHPSNHHQQGPFPPLAPPQQQQNNYIPPPPPRSNFGGPMPMIHQHQQPGPPPPPPPPPPQQHLNRNMNIHIQQQPIGIIPPPPPKQQNLSFHTMPLPTQPQQHIQQQFHQTQSSLFSQQQQQQQPQLQPQQQPQIQYPSLGQTVPTHQQTPNLQIQQQLGSTYHVAFPQQQQQQQQQLLQQPLPSYQLNAAANTQQLIGPTPTATSTTNTTTTTTNTDPEQMPQNWSTHISPTGINYYFNKITNTSTYTKPTCLTATTTTTNNNNNSITTTAVSTTAVTNNNTSINNNNQGNKERGWTQHMDKATGKFYYYNGKTTTWDKPVDFVDTDNTNNLNYNNELSSSSQPKKKRKIDNDASNNNNHHPISYNSKAEAIAAFKGLLLAKDISTTMKWNDVYKICSADNRWNACTSVGERKQALAEYQTKRAAELREQKRQEKVRAKDAFINLLTDVLPSVRQFNLAANTRFEEIRDSLSTDDRFYAVEDEETRIELYFDFVEELRKRDERQRRNKKREAKDNFLSFLKGREEIGSLTSASTWSTFLLTLGGKDKQDPRFLVSSAMTDSERQLYFADYVLELNAAEEEKKRRILDARRRAEKAQRNAYREALRSLAKEGKILPSSRWRNLEDEISAHESFDPVSDQDKNAPRDMFEDFVYDWADDYRRDKSFLNSLMDSSKDFKFTSDTKFDQFKEAVLKAAAYSPEAYSDARRVINEEIPVSSAKLYFDDLLLRAKNEDSMLSKRRVPFGRRNVESSEDEGEIVEEEEDGEVIEETVQKESAVKKEDGEDSAEEAVSDT